jgi:hypothetical protein
VKAYTRLRVVVVQMVGMLYFVTVRVAGGAVVVTTEAVRVPERTVTGMGVLVKVVSSAAALC